MLQNYQYYPIVLPIFNFCRKDKMFFNTFFHKISVEDLLTFVTVHSTLRIAIMQTSRSWSRQTSTMTTTTT